MQSRHSRGPTARIMSGNHCVCSSPGGKTLFEEGVFTSVLAAPATLPLRRSSGCARRWIRWRELRRAILYLLPFPSDPAPLSNIGSPPRGSSPQRKGSTLRLSFSEEGDREDVDEFSQNICSFAQACCE